jgi:hypothetical protein
MDKLRAVQIQFAVRRSIPAASFRFPELSQPIWSSPFLANNGLSRRIICLHATSLSI